MSHRSDAGTLRPVSRVLRAMDVEGSCLCGSVRYRVQGPLRHITHCHCGLCRKAHGAAFATYATVDRRRVLLVEGEALLGKYRSSEIAVRRFCVRCGSQLFFEADAHPDAIAIALGTVDGDPIGRPEAHIHVSGKAPWYSLEDSLPRYEEDMP